MVKTKFPKGTIFLWGTWTKDVTPSKEVGPGQDEGEKVLVGEGK